MNKSQINLEVINISLSIIVPVYKDSYFAEKFIKNVVTFIGSINLSYYEIIFVIDGGSLNDELILLKLADKHSFVKVIILSRNFGQHIALSVGYKQSNGDYVCMINIDQQEPVSEIPKLLNHIINNKSIDIVYGLRDRRKDKFTIKITSIFFYYLLNKLTGNDTPLNIATLRIMSRRFINSYNSFQESSRYIPGLENWLGFEKDYIQIDHQERIEGKSSYNMKKRISMALESIISFSDVPLKGITFAGFIVSTIGFFALVFLIAIRLYFVDMQPGYTSTLAIIIFLGGLQMVMIGFASIYIGRILKEVQNRPLYVIKEKINFDN